MFQVSGYWYRPDTGQHTVLHENDVLPRGAESPFLSALHAKNDTTNLFGHKLGESTEIILILYCFLNYQDNDTQINAQRTGLLGQSQLPGYAVVDHLGHPNHLKQLK